MRISTQLRGARSRQAILQARQSGFLRPNKVTLRNGKNGLIDTEKAGPAQAPSPSSLTASGMESGSLGCHTLFSRRSSIDDLSRSKVGGGRHGRPAAGGRLSEWRELVRAINSPALAKLLRFLNFPQAEGLYTEAFGNASARLRTRRKCKEPQSASRTRLSRAWSSRGCPGFIQGVSFGRSSLSGKAAARFGKASARRSGRDDRCRRSPENRCHSFSAFV